MSRNLRVFLLDDHDIVRRGLHDLLDPKLDITVVGDSGATHGVTERILARHPDVMLLDVQLQDGSGVRVCREVRSADPSIKGLLLTSHEDETALASAILAGADGYILKLSGSLDIVEAIRRVGAGRSLLGPADVDRGRARIRARADALDPGPGETEQQVLDLALEGLTDRQIAERLGADEQAVGKQVMDLVARLTR